MQEQVALRRANVLVVEDDAPLAISVERLVSELGHNPVLCVCGEDAIAKARELRPELILMDVMLRGALSGIDAAEVIKHDQLGCEIVFMTAHGDLDDARRMRQIAGSYVMGKPVPEAMLRLIVREKLGLLGRRVERIPRRP